MKTLEKDRRALRVVARLLQAIVVACAAYLARWFVRQLSDNYHTNTAIDHPRSASRVPPRPAPVTPAGKATINTVVHHRDVDLIHNLLAREIERNRRRST